MKRSKRLKVIAMTLLVIFVQSLVLPGIAHALTSGPTAPEATSFEPVDTTDMVNLFTGDFTYNLPVMNVPGPEGGYPINLFYHGGIKLGQEATHVGLGFGLNPGAINRITNGVADDYKGDIVSQNAKDKDKYTHQFSLGLGLGKNVAANLVFSMESEKGFFGVQDINNFEFSGADISARLGPIGITYSSFDGLSESINLNGIGYNFTNREAFAKISTGSIDVTLNSRGVTDISASGGISVASRGVYLGDYKNETNALSLGTFSLSTTRTWLENGQHDRGMYGSLYLNEFPYTGQNNKESMDVIQQSGEEIDWANPLGSYNYGSDKGRTRTMTNYELIARSKYPYKFKNRGQIAYDVYSVNGQGIGGLIQPHQFENGSLIESITNIEKSGNVRFGHISNSNYTLQLDRIHKEFTKKPQFRFLGENGSSLEMGNGNISMNANLDSNLNIVPTLEHNPHIWLNNDPTDDLIQNDYKDNYLAGKHHIEWFTNTEIVQNNAAGLMDYQETHNRNTFDFPQDGIGGFMVTDSDGKVYHYALPVYAKYEFHKTFDKDENPNEVYSSQETNSPYAYTWLLTAITGPDFIDKNGNRFPDEGDYGYWTRFDYGKWEDNYTWRSPYNSNEYNYDINGQNKTQSLGIKQLYYLNAISTRTHTAVFIRSPRKDGRGSTHATQSHNPVENYRLQLKLDEIRLYKNEEIQLYNLQTNSGVNSASNILSNNGFSLGNQSTSHVSNVNNIYDIDDINDSGINTSHLKANKFNYLDYSLGLCQNTINSFSGSSPSNIGLGKLTLSSLSFLNKNNEKIIPDYDFIYAKDANNNNNLISDSKNPDYNEENWDRWGYYRDYSDNNDVENTNILDTGLIPKKRYVSTYSSDNVDVWNLRKIRMPSGAILNIEYESDDYDEYGFIKLRLGNPRKGETGYIREKETLVKEYGGGIRVKSISLIDDLGKGLTTEYQYLLPNGKSSGVVTQEPPSFDRDTVSVYFPSINAIAPSVHYKRVEVISKTTTGVEIPQREIFEFESYDEAIHLVENVIESDKIENIYNSPLCGILMLWSTSDYLNSVSYQTTIEDRTSQVGQLLSHKKINGQNQEIYKTEYEYSDMSNTPKRQGIVSETFHQSRMYARYYDAKFDPIREVIIQYEEDGSICQNSTDCKCVQQTYWLHSVTNKTKYPSFLVETKTYKENGIVSSSKNTEFDFFTGAVTESISENSYGERFKTVSIPAYKKYPGTSTEPGMGLKIHNPDNKNMLTQTTASYLYKVDAQNNNIGVISAGVTTWKDAWTYRKEENGVYSDDNSNFDGKVWRKHKTYAYQGDREDDGTLINFIDFNWTPNATQSNDWKKIGEITLYDHYSKALEATDINNNFVATKMGYGGTMVIANIANAKYNEFTFSGAEDIDNSIGYFGGEVKKGNGGTVNLTKSHTGSSSLYTTGKGFIYSCNIGTDVEVTSLHDRKYRGSVWVFDDGTTNAALKYEIKQGTTVVDDGSVNVTDSKTIKAGNWYRLTLDFDIPNGTNGGILEIFTEGSGHYFDDFRFHPLDGAMNSYVYDKTTGQVRFILDDENFFTEYRYDDKGNLEKVYRESTETPTGVRLLTKHQINFGRGLD